MKKIGILVTHPIQYYSPLFRRLTQEKDIDLTVYYCHKPTDAEQGTGFGVPFQWDIDLLSGYRSVWLKNISKNPSLESYKGCDTPEIADIIKNEKFDFFMVAGWNKKSYWQAMRACWKTKTPLWVRGDSQLTQETGFIKQIVKNIYYPNFIKRFHTCFAVGQRSEAYFRHFGAVRILKSPHFVDNAWFAVESRQHREKRDALVFLFVGKFEEKKRPLDFLIALEKLKKHSHVPALGIMAGDGPLKSRCEAFVREKGLPVSFLGFMNQSMMPKVYAMADVLILPSDGRETWGLAVNEAMACGLPVIVSEAAGCVPELVTEGETGFVFPCGDTAKLARYMQKFAEDRSLVLSMSKKAEAHIQSFSAENAAKSVLKAMGGA